MVHTSLVSTSAESYFHKVSKRYICSQIVKNNKSISGHSLEKYTGKRFADIYFKFKNHNEFVVEIQNSQISVKQVIQRTKDYNSKGIYVLWILHGAGSCVGSSKYPINSKKVKISMIENYLHKLYGGRVYYINLKLRKNKIISSDLFALHFTKPFKKKMRGLFKGRFSHFYYRDALFMPIDNWKIFCSDFAGNLIARFYDKNLKSCLKNEIKSLLSNYNKKIKSEKKLIKLIEKRFKKNWGKFLVYKCLIELCNERFIKFHYKYLLKIMKSIN